MKQTHTIFELQV